MCIIMGANYVVVTFVFHFRMVDWFCQACFITCCLSIFTRKLKNK